MSITIGKFCVVLEVKKDSASCKIQRDQRY